jgi:hypothetical protein
MTAITSKPYILIGGFVDNKFISANQLAGLYGIPKEQCVLASSEAMICGMLLRGKIVLRPVVDGNYQAMLDALMPQLEVVNG